MISLPDALAEYAAQKRWVVWRYVRTAPDKKPTKVPYQPEHPRRKAKNNDPSTWSDFACASSACDLDEELYLWHRREAARLSGREEA